MNTDASQSIPPDVRAAISAFLEECKKNARPLAVSEALGAIRRIFPAMEISDLDLLEAITSEASVAGLDLGYDFPKTSDTLKRKSLERWDNDGGATEKSSRQETQRRLDNDTDGSRRRATDTKNRNRLV
ncbi:hypothetical protein [Mesorhizobium silamurunense]|uniref:hypothetical protein n=1 Tax=Mesorhizobium silamurunense TaxID=499528 RepID=UPI00177F1329|nr:hypothetical protein [Mesorhizobium silamurunense]